MLVIDAAIELIIPDNTAFTVLTSLRRLGYTNLTKVERSEHIILSVESDAAPEHVLAQLSRAEVLFNPNKHRLSYAVPKEPEAAAPPQFEAIIRDKDENNDRLVALLSGTFGMASLRGLSRAVGWRLHDEGGPATAERLEWACRMLLANGISQSYDIRPRPVRHQVRELGEAAAKAAR
jgi:phosphoribosylformylglycinamidine (FGAM) synthase PurS component